MMNPLEAVRINPGKYAINTVFIVISACLLIYVLPQMVSDPFLKALYTVLVCGIDIFRQYIAYEAKVSYRKGGAHILAAITFWIIYSVIMTAVLIVSVGFALSQVNFSTRSSTMSSSRLQAVSRQIKSYESQIDKVQMDLNCLSPTEPKYWAVS